MSAKAMLQCSSCGASKETTLSSKGLPKIQSQWGWKRRSEGVWCKDCWQKQYRLAAIILPIRPQDPKRWPELRPLLQGLWRQSTCLANWAIHQLALHDSVPVPSHPKLTKPRPMALYRLAVDNYPDWTHWAGQTQAANALLRMAEKRWRRDRYQVLWRRRQALPCYRDGLPYPLDAQAWRLERTEGGAYLLACSLGGSRWLFQLQTGWRRHQKDALQQIVDGSALPVEAALYERRRSLGDHRSGGTAAQSGSGNTSYKRLYAKLVCWLPKPKQEVRAERKLYVRTGQDVFWSAVLDEQAPEHAWVLHADHVQRWVMEHMVRLGKLADDTKYEKRWPKRQRFQLGSYRESLVAKHRRRMDTWIHQATASLVNYACRKHVTEMLYREEQGYRFNPFPWHRLRTTLTQKALARGIRFTAATTENAVAKDPRGSKE
jgi:hypothetical protein